MNDNELVCKHGQLARSCESCFWKKEVIVLGTLCLELFKEFEDLVGMCGSQRNCKISTHDPFCVKHQALVERARKILNG